MSKVLEKDGEATHAAVREHYARSAREAAELSAGSGCGCGTASAGNACCGAGDITGEANLAQGDAAPVLASWGCGSPTAIAALRPGQVVLDLGSGGGYDAFLAARAVAPAKGAAGRVIGVDMTPEMLELARANAQRLGLDQHVEFRQGYIEALPVEAQSVDVILSNCVINLAPDKAAVFREAFRVLRPGGWLSLSDIVSDRPLPQAQRRDLASWAGCVSGAQTEAEYLGAIRAAGFTPVEVTSREAWHREGEVQLFSLTLRAFKPG
ncbi:MAG: arsenite methyltransferase [Chloroflexi bacterium]|nr:arsenite methyltransferase [Chloroflexota bacterium]